MISLPDFLAARFKTPAPNALPDDIRAKTGPDRTLSDPKASYQRIYLDDSSAMDINFGPASSAIISPWSIPGDHLYISQINGTTEWGVKFGSAASSMIRLREGMVLHRNFTRLIFYTLNPPGNMILPVGTLQTSSLEAFVSTGPLIVHPGRKPKGYGPGAFGRINCIANTVRRGVIADYYNVSGVELMFPGRDGATLLLRNSDLSNTLILSQMFEAFSPGQATDIWQLYPGEALVLELDGTISDNRTSLLLGNGFGSMTSGLNVYCLSGTCLYDWCVTRRSSDMPNGIGRVEIQ